MFLLVTRLQILDVVEFVVAIDVVQAEVARVGRPNSLQEQEGHYRGETGIERHDYI